MEINAGGVHSAARARAYCKQLQQHRRMVPLRATRACFREVYQSAGLVAAKASRK